jgi:hypothetical protein
VWPELAALGNLLEQRKQIFHGADLLLVDQDVSILQSDFHPLRISHEVRRQIAAVELHSLDHFQLRLQRLRLFHRDNAVLADLLHGFGNDVANGLIIVRRNGADLRNHFAGNGLRELVDLALTALAGLLVISPADQGDSLLDAALHGHRIRAGSDRLYAFAINRLGQNGRSRGSIASHI